MAQVARAQHEPLRAEFLTIAGYLLYDIEKHLSSMLDSRSQEPELALADNDSEQEPVSYIDVLARLQHYLNDYDQWLTLAHMRGNNTNKGDFLKQADNAQTTFHKEFLALISAHRNEKVLLE